MSGPGGSLILGNISNVLPNLGPTAQWIRIGVGLQYTLFQTAALTININLANGLLPIGTIIHGSKIKHSTAFAGGAIATAALSLGISGSVAKYGSAFDVFQTVSGTAFQVSSAFGAESMSATAQLTATMTATGANLSALTAGQADIWAFLSIAN